MTDRKEQELRLLLDRYVKISQHSLIKHLTQVVPLPALKRAVRTWPRNEEWDSLEATLAKIMDVVYEPVTVTRLLNEEGNPLRLVGLAEAAPLVGLSHRALYDLSLTHAAFPEPTVVTSTARLWVADDIESFCRARQPVEGWRLARTSRKKLREQEGSV
jgi:hypothetical protein